MDTILIIGAKSDMAQALARKYATAGYDLILAARDSQSLTEFAGDLKIRYEVSVESIDCDILDLKACENLYRDLPNAPSGVICAVGYLGEQSLAQTNSDEARKIMDTNFTGPAQFLDFIARDFELRSKGFIVGISSVAGDRGRKSNYFYGAAKAGFTTYLSGLRNRLSDKNIQVLTVKPGFVQTQMTAHLTLPPRLTASAEKAANDIFKAQQKGRNVCYTLGIWRWIMMVIKLIPEGMFKKMSIGK